MEKQLLFLDARREGYSIDKIHSTMTVGELISFLQDFDEDLPIYLSHDNGYTYGGIREGSFHESENEDEDEQS